MEIKLELKVFVGNESLDLVYEVWERTEDVGRYTKRLADGFVSDLPHVLQVEIENKMKER